MGLAMRYQGPFHSGPEEVCHLMPGCSCTPGKYSWKQSALTLSQFAEIMQLVHGLTGNVAHYDVHTSFIHT